MDHLRCAGQFVLRLGLRKTHGHAKEHRRPGDPRLTTGDLGDMRPELTNAAIPASFISLDLPKIQSRRHFKRVYNPLS